MMLLGLKVAPLWTGGYMFYIGLYRENMKNILVWNHKA